METIYLICSEWNLFDETELQMSYLYAVRDEITARNDCRKFQIQYNKQKGKTCFKNKRYYYEKLDLYTF